MNLPVYESLLAIIFCGLNSQKMYNLILVTLLKIAEMQRHKSQCSLQVDNNYSTVHCLYRDCSILTCVKCLYCMGNTLMLHQKTRACSRRGRLLAISRSFEFPICFLGHVYACIFYTDAIEISWKSIP